mmetsp:Transcript_62424/g.174070  ORF Transcript_62424/g.174070 Transcript_62424/m.174070 type:complete len:102 (+) Transcript_62424:197-502(+)
MAVARAAAVARRRRGGATSGRAATGRGACFVPEACCELGGIATTAGEVAMVAMLTMRPGSAMMAPAWAQARPRGVERVATFVETMPRPQRLSHAHDDRRRP